MLVAGSNCFDLKMVKDEVAKVADVEEGEIFDSASVEQISEEDFNKQELDVVVVKEPKPKDTRVWTMRDIYKYQIARGYVSGFYNLAWAQAVQNKPLNDLFVEVEPDENSKRSSPSSSVASSINSSSKEEKRVDKVVIDDSGDEMEEGELEEGEIDLDSEQLEPAVGEAIREEVSNNEEMDVDGSELDEVKLIREALESVTVIEAEKSFDAVCSKVRNTFDRLRLVVQQNNVPTKDALVELLFSAVQVIYSVFGSMNHDLKDQNKDIFSRCRFRNPDRFVSEISHLKMVYWLLNRLLCDVNTHDSPLFSPGQIKEIKVMASSLGSSNVLLSARFDEKEKEKEVLGGVDRDSDALVNSATRIVASMNKLSSSGESFVLNNKLNMLAEVPKTGVSFKSRAGLLPLLDLHKDHDADSLPSPTRETAPSLPVQKVMTVADGMTKSGLHVAKKPEDYKLHRYETDALRAVSSYQQKFGRNSFFTSDRLPSPTPSEESGGGDGDTGGEVSSSINVSNMRTVNPPSLDQQTALPSHPRFDSSNRLGVGLAKNVASLTAGSTSTAKATAKSRDPRLRFMNADLNASDQNQCTLPTVNNVPKVDAIGAIASSRKQKLIDDPIMDEPSLKRRKNVLENPGIVRDVKTMTGCGGWLEDSDIVGTQTINRKQLSDNPEYDSRRIETGLNCPSSAYCQSNTSINGTEQIAVRGTGSVTGGEQAPATGTTSLPDLLKDIAVNPTMLINILKMGQQQRLALEAQQKLSDPAKSTVHHPSSNAILGTSPMMNVTPPQSSVILPRQAGTLPSQTTTADELGKLRMKPRDPRRVLQNNALQRTGSMSSEQLKTNITSTSTTQGAKETMNAQTKEGQAEMMPVSSQLLVPPDISLPFTKSLKNIADIVSVSQASATSSLVSQNLPSQPSQIKSDRVHGKPLNLSSDNQTRTMSTLEVGVVASRSQNWGDVEHLFEGYDDHQKVAIQKERARRIEEQKKMFSARKLCLVLDLDHTLLNSAKFNEVEPVHDEILRKKEEQDREKPHRHLFRFPHMGMWTKLRPGIWNFLEKASKLYELHLYTMGNKLYATEMAKVLDPKGVLFNGRVISRGDDGDALDSDERVPKTKDLEGVLGMESGVVIIDDSVRVWPHNKLNLIVVERYIYFPCSRRQFGLAGHSLLEIDHDERPEDGTLASSLAVIEKIHQNFFAHHSLDDADVRNILASEQRKILAGCRIVFSRVFPVGEANPHLHPLWQTAEQFGAVCTNQIDEKVTHVVANSLGTDKVNWANATGRFVVNPCWVEASALLYRRANEQDFAIKQ